MIARIGFRRERAVGYRRFRSSAIFHGLCRKVTSAFCLDIGYGIGFGISGQQVVLAQSV